MPPLSVFVFGKKRLWQCEDCGMEYFRGDVIGELNHKKFHAGRDRNKGVKGKTWKFLPQHEPCSEITLNTKIQKHIFSLLRKDFTPLHSLPESLKGSDKVYTYVVKNFAVGLLWVKDISNTSSMSHQSSAIQNPSIGIELIWVLPIFRRKGIALKMLRAATEGIDKDRVAFSQTTTQGTALATRFLESRPLLIYDD